MCTVWVYCGGVCLYETGSLVLKLKLLSLIHTVLSQGIRGDLVTAICAAGSGWQVQIKYASIKTNKKSPKQFGCFTSRKSHDLYCLQLPKCLSVLWMQVLPPDLQITALADCWVSHFFFSTEVWGVFNNALGGSCWNRVTPDLKAFLFGKKKC